ncbi:MAG: sigma-54-dependent transcriptional regulator [Betaproteobacteria bacterium]
MPNPQDRICLIEDDAIMGESLCDRFSLEGFDVDWHRSAEAAMPALMEREYGLAIGDIRLPGLSGAQMFRELRATGARLPPFIFITGFGAVEQAVELLKLGAADYVTKPFDLDRLMEKVRSLLRHGGGADNAEPRLGVSVAMRRIEQMLPRLASHARTLLITGESGVGKEHVALELHRLAAGDAAPFIAVNCGAFTETLLETELFGHEKGAFTGAVRARKGVFEQAHGGTLFLDEVGEMPPAMQVKLLRAIQDRRIQRVGGEAAVAIDVRIVLATHRDLKHMVEEGRFREDLFYRVNVITLKVPPLRERREDILWFAEQFLAECGRNMGVLPRRLHPGARQAMLEYAWPGNVRELLHCIERACILTHGDELRVEELFASDPSAPRAAAGDNLNDYLMECERAYIRSMLDLENGQIARTAARLGISRKNLWEKMKKLGIQESVRE